MSAIEKFIEAALELQKEDACVALENARKVNDNDEVLQEKINAFRKMQENLQSEMANPEADKERLKEMDGEIEVLYNEIMANPSMVAYGEAQQDIKEVINHINAIIAAAIDGQDPRLVQAPSCCDSGGCSSCSGCG